MIGVVRRRVMGGGGGSLPYDAEIEYLTGTYGPYINTGVCADQDTKIDLKCRFNSDHSLVFGSGASYRSNEFCVYRWGGIEFHYANSVMIYGSPSSSMFYRIVMDKETVYLYDDSDNLIYNPSFAYTNFGGIYPIYIYVLNRNNVITTDSSSSCSISYFKIFENDILIKDFIPVRIGQVGYLYDRVSGQLFSNAGTGSFILGPDV